MVETQYEVIPAGKPKAPPISLIRIFGDRSLVASRDAFGPDYFSSNVAEMQKQYLHPKTGEIIILREPTTAESVLIASCDFTKRVKPKIFDSGWLQAGRVVRTSEGIYMNPPKYATGNPIADEEVLKSFLESSKKVNGIWLLDNDFGYAPYETFNLGLQKAGDFVESGLARVIEHSPNPEKLKEISSKVDRVNILGFDPVSKPVLRVVSLFSCDGGAGRLHVGGDSWSGSDCGGFAFGVLDSAEGTRGKNK